MEKTAAEKVKKKNLDRKSKVEKRKKIDNSLSISMSTAQSLAMDICRMKTLAYGDIAYAYS